MNSYKGQYVKYTGPNTRMQTHKNEVVQIHKGAVGVCSSVIGPKITVAFKEDLGKQVPTNPGLGHEASWKHQVDFYPFDESNSWEIELDL
ncbi:hypothetical protein [Hymenobacter sp. UYCo722]|uniref:hypothetical protein n=1 Tax=Hymenobacter sp. UYCo722 TaxID=3156335 RepID=UPI00339724AC